MQVNQLEEVIRINDWYRDLPADYNNVHELMHMEQKLSGLMVNFVNHVLKIKGETWKQAESKFYSEKYGMRANLKKTHSGVDSRDLSLAGTWKQNEEKELAETDYWTTLNLVESLNTTIKTMAQHVGLLKMELEYSRRPGQL